VVMETGAHLWAWHEWDLCDSWNLCDGSEFSGDHDPATFHLSPLTAKRPGWTKK
jgi:hypothetical protein